MLFHFELLVDWVGGWLGDVGEQKNQALVSRILFAGMCDTPSFILKNIILILFKFLYKYMLSCFTRKQY